MQKNPILDFSIKKGFLALVKQSTAQTIGDFYSIDAL
jgi:hypothetical protein